MLTETYASVIALRNDVGEAIVHNDLQPYVGVVREKFRQRRGEYGGRMLARGDANAAGRLVTQLGQCCELGFDVIEPRPHGADQTLTSFGRSNAARGTAQQAKLQTLFEATHA